MPVDNSGRVRSDHFAGSAKVHETNAGGLGALLRTMLQFMARQIVVLVAPGAITDSSGGTAAGELDPIDVDGLTVTDVEAAGGATPASLDAAGSDLMDAYATLIEHANLVRTKLGMGAAPEGTGTAGSGTIAAITITLVAGVSDAALSLASAKLVLNELLDRQRTVQESIESLRAAVGLGAMTLDSTLASPQGTFGGTLPMAALTAAALVTAGNADTEGVALADVEPLLDLMKDHVAELSDAMDEVSAVVAVGIDLAGHAR